MWHEYDWPASAEVCLDPVLPPLWLSGPCRWWFQYICPPPPAVNTQGHTCVLIMKGNNIYHTLNIQYKVRTNTHSFFTTCPPSFMSYISPLAQLNLLLSLLCLLVLTQWLVEGPTVSARTFPSVATKTALEWVPPLETMRYRAWERQHYTVTSQKDTTKKIYIIN